MDIISRKDAKILNASRYYTGRPCPRGHISERYILSKSCVACHTIKKGRKLTIRKAAILSGHKRYSTGKPCSNGHIAERQTSNGHCVICSYDVSKNQRLNNPEKQREALRRSRKNNPEQRRESHRKSENKMLRTNINYKLAHNLRTRLRIAIRKGEKCGSAVRNLGCSIPDFKQYLEQKFKIGMTWENYGSVWHIDHKIPLYKYDLSILEQLLEACHYTNLQPLFVDEHKLKTRIDFQTIAPLYQ